MQHGELRSDRGSRLVNEFFIQFSSFNLNDTFKTGEASFYIFLELVFFTNYSNIKWKWDSRKRGSKWNWFKCWREMIERRDPLFAVKPITSAPKPTKNPKTNKEETTIELGNTLFADSGRAPSSSEILEWLQEFRENLVYDEIPVHGDSHASSSHEVSLEPTSKRREDLGEHRVYTHFPKDRNCEICPRTKITRAPCRRRSGAAVPRAENFWWFGYSRSQNSQWRLWISKQSPICSRVAGSSHSMDPGVSVQKQNFTTNSEKLAKVPGTREET